MAIEETSNIVSNDLVDIGRCFNDEVFPHTIGYLAMLGTEDPLSS